MHPLLVYPGAILLISLLVIIHEFGHYLVARAFGMRVITYSIGFGPVLWRWRPRGSETVFQIAAIPVLAYVQIAGMNPREVADPNDRGSYQNATPIARFLTIAAGPLANYVAAGLALFLVVKIGGEQVPPAHAQIGQVMEGSPASSAGFQPEDTVRQINDTPIATWEDLLRVTGASNGRPMRMVVDRAQGRTTLTVTPRMNAELHRYTIGIMVKEAFRAVGWRDATERAIVGPAGATTEIVKAIVAMVERKAPVQLVGPVGIVRETATQARRGWRHALEWAGIISLQLFIFNLLPIPALDGGRMMVLGYEIVRRRRPDPDIEARVLSWSLALMIGLFLFVTYREIWGMISGWLHA